MQFVTTNIRLGADIYRRLRLKAFEDRKSLAQLIREAVEQVYGGRLRDSKAQRSMRQDSFFKLIGICETGIKDGAIHHDRDIYGVDL